MHGLHAMKITVKRGAARLMTPPPPANLRGLGDLVALVAEPIARAVNLNKSKCGCAKRQEWLNAKVPFA